MKSRSYHRTGLFFAGVLPAFFAKVQEEFRRLEEVPLFTEKVLRNLKKKFESVVFSEK
jgi:hypothetical protein